MPILEKTQTVEQVKNEKNNLDSLQNSVMDSITSSNMFKELGLPTEQIPNKKDQVEQEEPEAVEEEVQEEADSTEENIPQEIETQEEEDSTEEEVVPKSKIQPRIDKLTATIKALENEVNELKAKSSPEVKDDITKQLESMSEEQLKQVKLQVRREQIKAQNDDAKLNELLSLEDKIDNVLTNSPNRFSKAQAESYAKAAAKIENSGEIPDLAKHAPKILEIAKEIYTSYPKFQKDVDGQAMALELAVKHFKATLNQSVGKAKVNELKQQVNTLKRKTTLDTKSSKSNSDQIKVDNLRKNAINGTLSQKINLVKNDPAFNVDAMIPEQFLGR